MFRGAGWQRCGYLQERGQVCLRCGYVWVGQPAGVPLINSAKSWLDGPQGRFAASRPLYVPAGSSLRQQPEPHLVRTWRPSAWGPKDEPLGTSQASPKR
eukprot:365617-Chlamydomonas_euryale.AAC.19